MEKPPFYCKHELENVHVLVAYNAAPGGMYTSHSGLAVNSLHTIRSLRKHHIRADAVGIRNMQDMTHALRQSQHITHCIIEAPWIPTNDLRKLINEHPSVQFIVRIHSQIGFLQVEAGAIRLIREDLALQDEVVGLAVAANSIKLKRFIEQDYAQNCLYLPNLYEIERASVKRHRPHDHRLLRIGSFGALRVMKNHTTALAAAMEIATTRGCDLEFYVNVHREEHGNGVLQALRNMSSGLPWCKLVEVPWSTFANFRKTIRHMDLCMQISFSETFNLVTADAVAEGVPSVTSPAIEWVPKHWHADPDSVSEVGRVGMHVLSHPCSGEEGHEALYEYGKRAVDRWLDYLASNPT